MTHLPDSHPAESSPGDQSRLARRLARHVEGPVRFDALSRALYSTDGSIYERPPLGVVLPKTLDDVEAVLEVAREEGVPVLPRGAGTSQCGQTVGRAVVVDTSRYLTRVCETDLAEGTATVEPGIVLDALNRELAPSGLFFPVDVATASRATIGGMAGNNSGGARSIRYGVTADNVLAIEASLPEGGVAKFGSGGRAASQDRGVRFGPEEAKAYGNEGSRAGEIEARVRKIVEREAAELRRQVPRVARHVAGYNLHRLLKPGASMAELLVGSEGTLGFFRRITLKLARRPRHRVLAIWGFPSLRTALDSVQHMVELGPHAVELVDDAVLRLARENDEFRGAVEGFAADKTQAVLLVEFAGEEKGPLLRKLDALEEATGSGGGGCGLSRVESAAAQEAVWRVRRAAMSIVLSAKGPRKPVSIVEDCAVPLAGLAEYAEAVEEIFARHGTRGTWYAHASVGCLHVRPSLDVRDPTDLVALRSIAEETHAVVRRLGGSHSGEHGDGILRSEFIEPMLGSRLALAFTEVKRAFDPAGLMNPGKIVDAPRMDDAALLRLGPPRKPTATNATAPRVDGAAASRRGVGSDGPRLPVAARQADGELRGMGFAEAGGFAASLERCNNNGACRKTKSGVMCPSFRVTREERDVTRGRANVLRLAMSGALGPEGLSAPEVVDALDLCVACKACRRECPAGVDMTRMKAEALYRRRRARRKRGDGAAGGRTGVGGRPEASTGAGAWRGRGPGGGTRGGWASAFATRLRGLRAEARQRVFAELPRFAPVASRARWALNLRNRSAFLARAAERLLGVSADRALPSWRRPFREAELGRADGRGPVRGATKADSVGSPSQGETDSRAPRAEAEGLVPEAQEVVLFVDTFHRYFEPEVARAAADVLRRCGVGLLAPPGRGRPLCCGRTWISAGLLDQARAALTRTVEALAPLAACGLPVVGLEPSCLLTLREDAPLLIPGRDAREVARRAVLLDEYLAAPDGPTAGRFGDPAGTSVPAAADPGTGVAHVHGHCHQKAAGTQGAAVRVLDGLAGLRAVPVESTCCGMAGSFGYESEHASVSRAMAELDLAPAVRAAGDDDFIVANGFSCRSQIRDGTGRSPLHLASLLAQRMDREAPARRGPRPAGGTL